MGDKRENRNEEPRPERSRKQEKVVPEPQTEYLDMDTDEEEFGRQGRVFFFFIKRDVKFLFCKYTGCSKSNP